MSFDQVLIATKKALELQTKSKAVVGTLPPRQQEIVFLRFYENFSYPKIADIIGLTMTSAYKLLYKALASVEVEVTAA